MKNKIILPFACLIVILSMAFITDPPVEKDYADCLKKIGTEWGESCPDCKVYKNSYRVKYQNDCDESLDIMVCVREADKSWRKFMFKAMAPKDSMVAYACDGPEKARTLKWACKAGDKSYVFPTIDEVNSQYKD